MMKRIAILLIALAGIVGANAQKFALIDMEYILKNIPAYERANEQLNQISKKWQSEVEVIALEAQTLYKNYQSEAVFLFGVVVGGPVAIYSSKIIAILYIGNKGPRAVIVAKHSSCVNRASTVGTCLYIARVIAVFGLIVEVSALNTAYAYVDGINVNSIFAGSVKRNVACIIAVFYCTVISCNNTTYYVIILRFKVRILNTKVMNITSLAQTGKQGAITVINII